MLTAELLVQLFSKDGKLLKELKQPSRSFVKAFTQMLYIRHSYLGYSVLDITNNARALAIAAQFNNLKMIAPGGNALQPISSTGWNVASAVNADFLGDQVGIQVGSNATAPTANDVAMNTRIAHGQAAGQLVYGGSEIEPIVVAAPNASILLRRYFTNKSGGNVTVNEVGIHTSGSTAAAVAYIFLICRDALGAPVVVANTEILRVQYTIQVTV